MNINEINTAETLSQLLQKRMRDLEAETCRRLIAWEDEKYGKAPVKRDTVPWRRRGFQVYFKHWIIWTSKEFEVRKIGCRTIKPLTDDCREGEEVKKQLDSYEF